MTSNAARLPAQDAAGAPAGGRAPADPRSLWTFTRAGARERPAVEAFIRDGFARAYGARLARLMPTLMVLRRGHEIAAACGLRDAAAGPLFLETYLDRAIEAELARATGQAPARADIVEVGNLVIARAGDARRLIFHLTTRLHAAGRAWAVFTAVPALRNSFRRMGIPLVPIAPAAGGRLAAAARAEWGGYYDQDPQVTAVPVAPAFHAVCEAACTR